MAEEGNTNEAVKEEKRKSLQVCLRKDSSFVYDFIRGHTSSLLSVFQYEHTNQEEQERVSQKVRNEQLLHKDPRLGEELTPISFGEAMKNIKIIGFLFAVTADDTSRALIHTLQSVHAKWKEDGDPLEIIFVSQDEDKSAFEKGFREHHGNWLAVQWNKDRLLKLNERFNVTWTPWLVFVDHDWDIICESGFKQILSTRKLVGYHNEVDMLLNRWDTMQSEKEQLRSDDTEEEEKMDILPGKPTPRGPGPESEERNVCCCCCTRKKKKRKSHKRIKSRKKNGKRHRRIKRTSMSEGHTEIEMQRIDSSIN